MDATTGVTGLDSVLNYEADLELLTQNQRNQAQQRGNCRRSDHHLTLADLHLGYWLHGGPGQWCWCRSTLI